MTPEMAKEWKKTARHQDAAYRATLRRQKPKCRCGKLAQYNKHGSWVCTNCEPFKEEGQITNADVIVGLFLGETVVTNDRVLNHALQQAAGIIGRRDIAPIDKFEMLAAYVLKARRELLGQPED